VLSACAMLASWWADNGARQGAVEPLGDADTSTSEIG